MHGWGGAATTAGTNGAGGPGGMSSEPHFMSVCSVSCTVSQNNSHCRRLQLPPAAAAVAKKKDPDSATKLEKKKLREENDNK